jgi:pimeloyl-ACP methyl ester carboxylesterase
MTNTSGQELRIEIEEITTNGMTFHCRTCGMKNSGEPVILMHGFPETSHMWQGLMMLLASKGYRCLAPDLRGYSPGARPKDIKSYGIDKIAADIIQLADSVGFEKIHTIGHDWGAGCGWTVVELAPNLVNSWSALSVPHMQAWDVARKTDPDQKKKGRYMKLFQLPLLPELGFGIVLGIKGLPDTLYKHSSPGEVKEYMRVLNTKDAREAAFNWYRANKELLIPYHNVSIPTLLIWGNEDIAFGRAGIEATQKYMMKGKYELLELNAGHTLIQEKFDEVSTAILGHLQKYPIA